MNYYLVGSGNMAWFLMARMQGSGHSCSGIMGRNKAAVAELAREYNVPVLQSLNDGADACLMAVSDSSIGEVAKKMSFKSTVLIHHSGSIGMNALAIGASRTGVVWPVYSILKKDLPTHRQFPVLWETNHKAANAIVADVCNALTAIQYEATSEQRQWMHLSAVLGNNFTNYLLGMCADICKDQQLPFNLLQPILQQTIDRVNIYNPKEVQTGPARRDDLVTQEKHLAMMSENPHWQAVYAALSAAIKNTYQVPGAKD
jgi:predicted short-subunit dehydrogenase-like oxidoreductase (DUF2520 family)